MENLNLISVKAGKFSTRHLFTFFCAKTEFFPIYEEFLDNMVDTKRLTAFIINQLNCFSTLLVKLLHNFILRDHIFRRNLSIISFAVTRKNKSLKKSLMKQMQLLRRKSKYKWVANGRDDIFWQNLLNQKSRDPCWKKNFRLPKESFSSLHVQLTPCSCRP